jgi:outer membrane protein OmpA-like peptidoglycan-associated protein
MKKFLFSLIALALAMGSFAQKLYPYKRKPSIAFSFFLKDMYLADYGQTTPISKMGTGLSVSYYEGITNYIDFVGKLSGSSTKYPFSAASGVTPSTTYQFFLEADASLHVKLLTDKYVVVPYLSFGVGASTYATTYYAAYIPLGMGLEFNVGKGTFINAMYGYNARVSDLAVGHYTYSIGVGIPLSKKKEKPPVVIAPPPPPAPVVAEKDTDGDGIVDSKDKCPTVAGVAKYDGCPVPDRDNDGVPDDIDQCPNVKGLAKYNGCPIPDRDKDGINDEEDKCPDVPGLARYQGCPIPDRDKDGINDEEDKCPDVPGVKENNGCPVVKAEVVKKVAASAKNILFATGSEKILSSSYKALDDVAAILKEDAALKLDIEGYTDNVGTEKTNIELSQKRAKAVYDYLTLKGKVEPSKLTSEGYGPAKPVADNKTVEGRTLNRRVELKLKY